MHRYLSLAFIFCGIFCIKRLRRKYAALSRLVYDKQVYVRNSAEIETLCPDCFHGISKTDGVFRADKCVYRRRADLHVQVFGSTYFQHGIESVE